MGEIQRLRRPRSGHLYFELTEKGAGDDIVGKLDAVAWRRNGEQIQRRLAASGQHLAEGIEIRCRVGIDFYPPHGRLQVVVREVDPVFTLGELARRRRQTLEALAAGNLLERNRRLPLSPLPLNMALITSDGSAAYHDFLSTLRESSYGFRVLFFHAAVQGKEAEIGVTSALDALEGLDIDCAVLIRGGGSRTDLAAFDSRAIAEAVARAPVPVLTGLGHEIDESIADRVAHSEFKTPTKVAEFLVDRVAWADRALAEIERRLAREAEARLRRSREAVARARRELELATARLASAEIRLAGLARQLGAAAGRRLRYDGQRVVGVAGRIGPASMRSVRRDRRRVERVMAEIAARSGSRLREAGTQIDGWSRLCQQLDPQRTLERGFAITRDSRGTVVRRATDVGPGERIATRLADGDLTSVVEETK